MDPRLSSKCQTCGCDKPTTILDCWQCYGKLYPHLGSGYCCEKNNSGGNCAKPLASGDPFYCERHVYVDPKASTQVMTATGAQKRTGITFPTFSGGGPITELYGRSLVDSGMPTFLTPKADQCYCNINRVNDDMTMYHEPTCPDRR